MPVPPTGCYTYERIAAEGNQGVVGGGGTGTARVFRESNDSASQGKYGRIEFFRDRRDTSVTAQLDQTLVQELEDRADKTNLSIKPQDTAAVSYGVHYGLGDRVSVMVGNEEIKDVVREVQLDYTHNEGEMIEPVIGSPGARNPKVPKSFREIEEAKKRLEQLEVAQ